MTTRVTRRQFLRWALSVGALGVCGGGGAYATQLEPYRLSIERVALRLARWPRELDGFTIAQLSDLHQSNFMSAERIRAVADAANQLQSDLIVLTGDYVYGLAERAAECARGLAGLRAPLGVFAILGNHDYWEDAAAVTRALRERDIHVLKNEAVPLARDGGRVWLAGLDDVWEHAHDIQQTLRIVPKDEATILLAHEPDFADEAARHPIDLQLSGHSHGGQVRLPGLGALLTPYLGRKYPMGLYRVGALTVYTNRGIGMIRPAIRFNCPPEVTLFTLRSSSSSSEFRV